MWLKVGNREGERKWVKMVLDWEKDSVLEVINAEEFIKQNEDKEKLEIQEVKTKQEEAEELEKYQQIIAEEEWQMIQAIHDGVF